MLDSKKVEEDKDNEQIGKSEGHNIYIKRSEVKDRRIKNPYVPHGVLARPLLKGKDNESNSEANKISFSKESFLPSQIFACLAFFFNGGLDLSKLVQDMGRSDWRPT